MPLQSSGAISISQIRTELGSSSYSLRTLSAAAGKSTPDAMSEFYGYSAAPSLPSGLVARYDAGNSSSYSGSGSTWYDLSGNGFHATLTNPSWSSAGYFNSDSGTNFVVPGNTTIYSSNFTWCIRFQVTSNLDDWTSLWWSETGTKNFILGGWGLGRTSSGGALRVDTGSQSIQCWNGGSGTTNQGASPALVTFQNTGCSPLQMITIVKNGSTFTYYQGDASGTPLWTVTVSSWSIGNTSQGINLMCQSQGSRYTTGKLAKALFFNRALSTSEISSVYSSTNITAC
jgi:hypothetical protein